MDDVFNAQQRLTDGLIGAAGRLPPYPPPTSRDPESQIAHAKLDVQLREIDLERAKLRVRDLERAAQDMRDRKEHMQRLQESHVGKEWDWSRGKEAGKRSEPIEYERAAKLKNDAPPTIPPGFLPWTGGECPVDPETYVRIFFRDGESNAGFPHEQQAQDWRWTWDNDDSDIVGYRVAHPSEAAAAGALNLEHQSAAEAPAPVKPPEGEGWEPVRGDFQMRSFYMPDEQQFWQADGQATHYAGENGGVYRQLNGEPASTALITHYRPSPNAASGDDLSRPPVSLQAEEMIEQPYTTDLETDPDAEKGEG